MRQLILVEPQPSYIESSGRWKWPLPPQACFPGCCTDVVTASREWWEYAPSEAKPHPMAEAVRLRDDVWYWALPESPPVKCKECVYDVRNPYVCERCGTARALPDSQGDDGG